MIRRPCAREEETRRAAAAGRWTPALRAHAASCPACGDVALVVAALVAPSAGPPAAVSPTVLWARARARQRVRAARMVSRVVLAVQVTVALVAGAAVGWFGRWPSGWPEFWAGEGQTLLAAAAGVLIAGALAAARLISHEH